MKILDRVLMGYENFEHHIVGVRSLSEVYHCKIKLLHFPSNCKILKLLYVYYCCSTNVLQLLVPLY